MLKCYLAVAFLDCSINCYVSFFWTLYYFLFARSIVMVLVQSACMSNIYSYSLEGFRDCLSLGGVQEERGRRAR
jgi:hypothetical protein